MPPVGFDPTISMLERAKTVHALDCVATAIGYYLLEQEENGKLMKARERRMNERKTK
jgi:hypothetical protein